MEAMGRVISMMTMYTNKSFILKICINQNHHQHTNEYNQTQSSTFLSTLNLHQLNNKNSAVLRLRMCFLPFELISSNEVRVFRVDGSNEVVNAQLVQLPLNQLGKTDISHVMVDSWRNSIEKCWNNLYVWKKERKDTRNSESLAYKFY